MKSLESLWTGCLGITYLSVAVLVVVVALSGCGSLEPARAATERAAPTMAYTSAPSQPIASFSAGLRCMDTLLLDYGTRDLSVIVEDLVDPSQKVNTGTKEMLVSVVSDLTQRSRAIRLVASNKDWGNTVNHLSQALQREPFAVIPQYALRGSVSRQDTTAGTTLSVDLTLLTTRDFSVVPGIATRNSVVLFKQGKDFDGRAEIRKFGVGFNLAVNAAEAPTQALRALLELAAIELFGRLTKVPYWSCLGFQDSQKEIAAKIQGWYDAMAAHPADVIKYFQAQLRTRRVYDGPIDGAINAAFKEAVARYREMLGLAREPKLSHEFFKAYLSADHHQLAVRAPAAGAAAPAAASTSASTPASTPANTAATTAPSTSANTTARAAGGVPPLALQVAAANPSQGFARGEPVHLSVRPNRDAHVYCFLQDEQRKIMRFFPNRFQRDSRVQPAEGLQLPGRMRFEIFMNRHGVPETVACFATERDVLADLPAGLNGGDFHALPVATLEQVRNAFAQVSSGVFAQDFFELRLRQSRSDLRQEVRHGSP